MNYCATAALTWLTRLALSRRFKTACGMNYCATGEVITMMNNLNSMFQNRKRYELLRNFASAKLAELSDVVKFQNRKRYELLRNGVYLESYSNATSKFVLENDFIFKFKRRKNLKTLSHKFQKIITNL